MDAQDHITISVGSLNPAKIKAVETSAEKIFPSLKVIVKGCGAKSKVSDQPMSIDEAIEGARNRAQFAIQEHNADFGVGIESGAEKIGDKWFTSCWCLVVDRNGKIGMGSSSRLEIPPRVMEYIHNGVEMADALTDLTGIKDIRSSQGIMGLLSNGLLPRDVCEVHGIIFAFSSFISEAAYWTKQ